MIAKIRAALSALRAGEELRDPANWKTKQNQINVITAAIVAAVGLAKAFGIEVPMTETEINGAAYTFVVLIGLVNFYLTTATTKKIGFKENTNDPDSTIKDYSSSL